MIVHEKPTLYRSIKLWALMCSLCWLCACATTTSRRSNLPKGNPKKLQAIGENYIAAGKYALALKYLTAAERSGGDEAELYYDMALAYRGRGFPDKAIEYLKKALKKRKDYPEAHNALGALLAEKGQLTEAEREFKIALNNPFYETPHFAAYNLANLYYRQGEYKKAKEFYEQALEFAPNYAPAHFELGRVLENLGDLRNAWLHYKEAVQYNPRWAAAHFHYGRLCYRFGKIISARYSFQEVLKLAPDSKLAKAAAQYLKQMHVNIESKEELKQ